MQRDGPGQIDNSFPASKTYVALPQRSAYTINLHSPYPALQCVVWPAALLMQTCLHFWPPLATAGAILPLL